MPKVRFVPRQARAVDARLLPRPHADRLPVRGKADRIGLRVFEGDEGDDEVGRGLLRQVFVLGDDVFQQICVDLEFVAPLLEGDAEHLFALDGVGAVIGMDLDDVVSPLPLPLQNFQRLGRIAGGDDAVGYLAGDDARRDLVALVGEGDPVAEGRHPVRAARAGVGAGERRIVKPFDIVDKAGLFQALGELFAHSGRGRADVLEGGRRDHARILLELFDQLPAVQRIQKVDIPRPAVQDLERQIGTVRHKDAGGLLVGVAAVLELKFVHMPPPYSYLLIRTFSYLPVARSM